MVSRHTGFRIIVFAFLFSILGYTALAFAASVNEVAVEFQKGVSSTVRVMREGTEDDPGRWWLEIAAPGKPVVALPIPLQDGNIHLDELRAASFITPSKQELFLSFVQIRNGVFGWAYIVDFANGKAGILFNNEWLMPGFAASGAFVDQYSINLEFPNLSDRYMLSIGAEKKTDYDWLYNAQTGRLTETREITGNYPSRFGVVDPTLNGGSGDSLHSLEVAMLVAGAATMDYLGDYTFHLRHQGGKWQLHGDTHFIPAPGIRSNRFQRTSSKANMPLTVTARGLESAQPSSQVSAPLVPGAAPGVNIPPAATDASPAIERNASIAFEAPLPGGWYPKPRPANALNTANATYTKILKDYLGKHGLPDATPQIMQLFKVDLDGDGMDEVVIVAQNLIGRDSKIMTWERDTPLFSSQGIPRDTKKGEYSLVLVRKVVGGKVNEIPIYQHITLKNNVFGDAGWRPPLLTQVYQFADVDGDGIMEVIIGMNSPEGVSYQAYTIKGNKAVEIPIKGAGWVPSDDDIAPLTAGQAQTILQKWLKAHPLPPRPAVLAAGHEEYAHCGDAYYLFSLDDRERYWLNFLVHKKTGKLMYMMISDGEFATIEIEPLDAWYAKHF